MAVVYTVTFEEGEGGDDVLTALRLFRGVISVGPAGVPAAARSEVPAPGHQLPPESSAEYLWWAQGARDNQDARDEGLSNEVKDMIGSLVNLAKWHNKMGDKHDPVFYALIMAQVHCPDKLRRRYR